MHVMVQTEVCMAVILEVVQVLLDEPIHRRMLFALLEPRCSQCACGRAHRRGHGGVCGVSTGLFASQLLRQAGIATAHTSSHN